MSGINVNTTAGSKIYISSALPETIDESGFNAVTGFTKISRVTNFDTIAQTFTRVPFNDVEMRETYTLKGTKDPVEFTVELGRVASDAGQIAVLNAFNSDDDFSFYIETQDGTKWYFLGKVMDTSLTLGDVNTVIGRTMVVALNSIVIEAEVGTTTTTTTEE